jgi:hypothetical protein
MPYSGGTRGVDGTAFLLTLPFPTYLHIGQHQHAHRLQTYANQADIYCAQDLRRKMTLHLEDQRPVFAALMLLYQHNRCITMDDKCRRWAAHLNPSLSKRFMMPGGTLGGPCCNALPPLPVPPPPLPPAAMPPMSSRAAMPMLPSCSHGPLCTTLTPWQCARQALA